MTSYTVQTRCGKRKMLKISVYSAKHLWTWCSSSFCAGKVYEEQLLQDPSFHAILKALCPRRLIELQVSVFLAHLPAMWRDREKIYLDVRCLSRLYLWKVVGLFLTSTKETQTDGLLSMGTGQPHWPRRARHRRERMQEQGNKLFHWHANQTHLQSLAVNAFNSMSGNWDLKAELLDHTLFEMSSWLIVLQRRPKPVHSACYTHLSIWFNIYL